ncbi:MAG: Beta-propeller domains of methanol dehydrogenase type [Candidatus Jettenia ecosi]|uniref:Beta-propeller domains of methanol dehydrogenase type n=1 Tax=Candidatus Jettenia ecosi TaxID=2494326 RepID=A0A533QAF3_9BACT|nr:MAG: Beta-propeller domains of methanol dehydrogenase type [Candidatus Jettenia ecosi]
MNLKLIVYKRRPYLYPGLLIFFLCLCSIVQAQGLLPVPQRYVEDRAGIVSDTIERNLNGYLQELEQKTGAQLIVLTINTTGDIPIETYAIELATKWKLGQKGKDNGALVVIAKDDRAYRIEVGYGLEGTLPDSFCGTVGRTYFVPNFRKGNYGEGIYQGVVIIVHKIAEEHGLRITGMPNIAELRKKARGRENPLFSLVFLLILLPFILSYFFNRRQNWWGGPPIIFGGRGGFGSGGSGGFGGFGSFGGGGGGSFGGGGASGRW